MFQISLCCLLNVHPCLDYSAVEMSLPSITNYFVVDRIKGSWLMLIPQILPLPCFVSHMKQSRKKSGFSFSNRADRSQPCHQGLLLWCFSFSTLYDEKDMHKVRKTSHINWIKLRGQGVDCESPSFLKSVFTQLYYRPEGRDLKPWSYYW